jgi:hypothetical protein
MEEAIMPERQLLQHGCAALALLALGAFVAGPGGSAWAAPEPTELPGLRQAPDIPVSPLIRTLPDHARDLRGRPGMEPGGGGCDKDVDLGGTPESQLFGATVAGALDTGICTNADIDVYVRNGRTFVVQGAATDAAWTHSEVTNPSAPVMLGQFAWAGRAGKGTTTPDIKAFQQGSQDYIAMGLERTKITGACGVVIVNVTAPAAPVVLSQFIGADWCDTHNVFIETDANGDGAYIYATADGPADLRVLAINDPVLSATVNTPVEVGIYRRTDRNPPNDADVFNDAYVHDVTVVNGTVYAAYWNKGTDILSADLIRQPGLTGLFADETAATNVRPPAFAANTPFLAHHAFPNSDGSLVFLEDEITFDVDAAGNPVSNVEPVQMWTTAGVPVRADGLLVDDLVGDVPVNPAHNLEINFGLQPNRLYVGWYRAGLQAWDFDSVAQSFTRVAGTEPRTATVYHQAQTEAADAPFSGAWGIRVAVIDSLTYAFQSDRSFGLIVNCLGDAGGSLALCPSVTP